MAKFHSKVNSLEVHFFKVTYRPLVSPSFVLESNKFSVHIAGPPRSSSTTTQTPQEPVEDILFMDVDMKER